MRFYCSQCWGFSLAAGGVSVGGGSGEFVYGKPRPGDHWVRLSDREYFKIFSVEDESTIVMHADPSPESPVVKRLQRGDIVISDGVSHWGGASGWQRIFSGSDSGWIPQRYLIRARPRLLGTSIVPAAGSCSGYSPPWTASRTDRLLRVSLFPGRVEISLGTVMASQEPQVSMLSGSASGMTVDLVVGSDACPLVQGHSPVGMSATLIVTEQSGKRLLSGCCQAEPAAFSE